MSFRKQFFDEYKWWVCGAIGAFFIFIMIDILWLDYISFIGPKHENIRREIFEETKSYNEGKKQDLLRYRLQYMQSKDENSREVIESTIRMMYADYDVSKLEPVLQDFLKMVLYGENK